MQKNWGEMQEAIVKELKAKADELQERAEAVEKLADNFYYIESWQPTPLEYDEADAYEDLEDCNLFMEMMRFWPSIATPEHWGN